MIKRTKSEQKAYLDGYVTCAEGIDNYLTNEGKLKLSIMLKSVQNMVENGGQEPCEDAVSREDVHDMLENLPVAVENKWFNWLQKACIRLAELPPVTPQPKTGHWIRFKEFENGYYHIKCSECGQYWSVDGHAAVFKYCFNCGAKMIEPQESEKDACKDCYYNDGEVHAECVICDKAESEE